MKGSAGKTVGTLRPLSGIGNGFRITRTTRAAPPHDFFAPTPRGRLKTNREPSDAPYADRWPQRFEGGLEEFTSFPVQIDMEKKLNEHQMIVVSRYANAVISQWYLPYNIRPKDDWPRDIAGA